jgi:hypothetical protein
MIGWIDLAMIKRGLLWFWAAWLSVVTTTNLLDAFRTLDLVPASFAFVSGNWGWINQVMDPLEVPRPVQAFLFGSVIAWEGIAAVLFWWAAATYRDRPLAQESLTVCACGVNLGLWGAFQVLDEVFMAYQPEGVHRAIFLNQLATILLLHLLPARADPQVRTDRESAGDR